MMMEDHFEGVADEIFEITNIQEEILFFYKLELWKLCLYISFYVVTALVATFGGLMIVWYIKGYAPKNRSINRMILIDQVIILSQHVQWRAIQTALLDVYEVN